jgi:hypothetical protein
MSSNRHLILAAGSALLAGIAVVASAVTLRPVLSVYDDGAGGPLREPAGVACNDASVLVVSDTGNGRLVRYVYEGGSVKQATQIRLPQLTSPRHVKLSSKDEILVLDSKARQILHLTREGALKGTIGSGRRPAAALPGPVSFDLDARDNVYILDAYSRQVLVVDLAGKRIREIPLPGDGGVFTDLTVDAGGGIFLLDPAKGTIYSASREAQSFSLLTEGLRQRASFPGRITGDGRGLLYIVDEHGGAVLLLGTNGAVHARSLGFGWTNGLLRWPSQMCVNGKGEAFIADTANNRVQILELIQ